MPAPMPMSTAATTVNTRLALGHRLVDPPTSLGELLFGLIMTLTFTLGAGIIIEDEGREGARQLLIALIGCNIAWGLIDGVLYLAGQVFDRSRLRRIGQAVRGAGDQRSAVTIVAGELDELLDHVTSAGERDELYSRIATNLRSGASPPQPNTISRADLMGAFTRLRLPPGL